LDSSYDQNMGVTTTEVMFSRSESPTTLENNASHSFLFTKLAAARLQSGGDEFDREFNIIMQSDCRNGQTQPVLTISSVTLRSLERRQGHLRKCDIRRFRSQGSSPQIYKLGVIETSQRVGNPISEEILLF